jgi:HAE1 family hydrophobic/amphiphilic exporter-1
MTKFFLERPVFAGVASFIVLIAGLIAMPTLPIAQYPKVAPPEITVSANYIGANAGAVESAVTTPLEEAINGVEGLRYMSSVSSNDGSAVITVTFNLGRDLDAAQSEVQSAVLSATGKLPASVQQTGIAVKKSSAAAVLGIGIFSDGRVSLGALSDYSEHQVIDSLKRIPGVADIITFGLRRYAMRIWLDPTRLQAEQLTASDVISALQSQNQQVASGSLGAPPTSNGHQLYQIQLNAHGRLSTPDDFARIIIKRTPDGGYVRLSDVGHVNLGAEDYSTAADWNGRDCVGFEVVQAQNANALDVADKVRAALEKMKANFPPGVSYQIPFDATLFVRESIKEVTQTLIISILLVVLVIYAFLQNLKMTLVPMITIPVSLIGTFALMKVLGFSINTLTLFGLTLATGLVVDDAIVVIENIARFVQEKHLSPFKAAQEAMREISGAVIATSLVLLAVFVPVAFFPGSTGLLYQQFAITIACSIAISLFTALTLAPPLSAILLQDEKVSHAAIFRLINHAINSLRASYHALLPKLFRFRLGMLGLFALAIVVTGISYARTPSAFIPDEDQGYLIVVLQTPVGTSTDFERRVARRVMKKLFDAVPEAEGVFALNGFGFTGSAPNRGVAFLPLRPWSERQGSAHTFQAILGRLYPILAQEPEAQVFAFNPPSVQGIGNFGGFQFQVLDDNGLDFASAMGAANNLIGAVNADPAFARAFTSFRNDAPQFDLSIDREKTEQLGIPFGTLAQTLAVFEGSEYVNDFDYLNRSYRVYVQADAPYRSNLNGLESMYVRSPGNTLVPISSLMTPSTAQVPVNITHFNLARSIEVDGAPKPGVGSSDMIAAMQRIAAAKLPAGMSYAWSGLTRDQIEGGNLAALVFGLGIVFVFLVLAAQYGNLWDPFVILLSVPLALLGALWAIGLRGIPSDVFVQVGLVMLIGLASKNAILIVEFANQLRETGMNATSAVALAAETRLRPIIMTSLAFVFGILPLTWATGAGSTSRISLGTAVFGGMIVSTVLNLLFVPVIYVVLASIRSRITRNKPDKTINTIHRDELERKEPARV